MGTYAQKINISKSFTFSQNIKCEEPPQYQAMMEFFNPIRRCLQFFQPPSVRSSKIFESLTSRPPPYCWFEIEQPLRISCNNRSKFSSKRTHHKADALYKTDKNFAPIL